MIIYWNFNEILYGLAAKVMGSQNGSQLSRGLDLL